MICKKCGQEMEDGAKFCRYCGEPAEGAITEVLYNYEQPTVQSLMTPQKKNNVAVGIFAAIAAVLVVVIILLAIVVFGKNEKTPLNNIEKMLNKKPTNAGEIVKDIAPNFVSKAYLDAVVVIIGNDEYKDSIDEIYEESEKKLEDAWEELYDGLEEDLGKNVKFSYTIEDQEELEEEEIEFATQIYQDLGQYKDQLCEIVEILAETTELEDKEVKKLVKIVETLCEDLEKMKIKKGYKMEVELVAEGKEDDDSETYNIVVIKGNGEWFIDPVLTYVLNEEIDADELEDFYDDEIKELVDMGDRLLENAIEDLEDEVKEMDEDVIEELLDSILSEMEE